MCWRQRPHGNTAIRSSRTKPSRCSIPRRFTPATSSASASIPAMRCAATRSAGSPASAARGSCSAASTPRCIPEEPAELGGAHAVVKGDGDIAWGQRGQRLRGRRAEAGLRRRQGRRRLVPAGALGSDPAEQVHVGVGADRPRLPEALLVLLGVEDGRAEAAPAHRRCGDRRDRRAAPARVPVHRARRRQLLPGDAHRHQDGVAPRRSERSASTSRDCAPSGSS